MQAYAVYYEITHAPFSSLSTLCTILSLAVKFGLKIPHMDVDTSFLNAVLNDTIYVNPSPGYNYLLLNEKSLLLI